VSGIPTRGLPRAAALTGLTAAISSLGIGMALAAPTVSFAPKADYDTGLSGGSGVSASTTAAGDFTGDGKADVVVLDFYGFGDPMLMVNAGNGTFGSPANHRIPVGNTGLQLETVYPADFNADGKLDLLLGSTTQIWVLLGNGNGTFAQSFLTSYNQNNQKDAKVDDFNNDGKLDFVFKGPAGVKTWLGNGAGSFTAGPDSSYPAGQGYITVSGLATGEFNNDGKRDIAISDALTGKVFTMLGNGQGGFSGGTSVSMISATGVVPGTVLVGDYNHDGRADVATINEFTDTLHSLAVALANGSGGFNTPSFYEAGVNPSTAALADLNHDGNLDVVSSDTTGSQQVVQLGNGNGTFTLGGKYPTNTGSQTPAVADYNGDTKPDIAVVGVVAGFTGDALLSVLLNTTP
jgi:hypothetical protein